MVGLAKCESLKQENQFGGGADYAKASALGILQGGCVVGLTQWVKNTQFAQQQATGRGMSMPATLCDLGLRGAYRATSTSLAKVCAQNVVLNPFLLAADRMVKEGDGAQSPFMLAGLKAGLATVGKTAVLPFDNVLSRCIGESVSPSEALKRIAGDGLISKVAKMYDGIGLEATKHAIGLGALFLTKDEIKGFVRGDGDKDRPLSVLEVISAGIASSGLAKALNQPLDGLVREIQNPKSSAESLSQAIEVLNARAEKVGTNLGKLLYRGFAARVALGGVGNAATIAVLEVMQFLTEKKEMHELDSPNKIPVISTAAPIETMDKTTAPQTTALLEFMQETAQPCVPGATPSSNTAWAGMKVSSLTQRAEGRGEAAQVGRR